MVAKTSEQIERALNEHFSRHGRVEAISVRQGFAYLRYASAAEAARAMLDEKPIVGGVRDTPILIKWARPGSTTSIPSRPLPVRPTPHQRMHMQVEMHAAPTQRQQQEEEQQAQQQEQRRKMQDLMAKQAVAEADEASARAAREATAAWRRPTQRPYKRLPSGRQRSGRRRSERPFAFSKRRRSPQRLRPHLLDAAGVAGAEGAEGAEAGEAVALATLGLRQPGRYRRLRCTLKACPCSWQPNTAQRICPWR